MAFFDLVAKLAQAGSPEEVAAVLRRAAFEGHTSEASTPRTQLRQRVVRENSPTLGPMNYIAGAICRRMAAGGYPARVHTLWRPPEEQDRLKAEGFSKASAWSSPHQFLEAADIVHASRGWDVGADFWDYLGVCCRVLEDDLGVDLTGGFRWGWDLAHVEIKDWRSVRLAQRLDGGVFHRPTPDELDARFRQVLPTKWRPQSTYSGTL